MNSTPNFDRLLAALPSMSQKALNRLATETGEYLERIQQDYNDTFILDDAYEAAYQSRRSKPLALLAAIKDALEPFYGAECAIDRARAEAASRVAA